MIRPVLRVGAHLGAAAFLICGSAAFAQGDLAPAAGPTGELQLSVVIVDDLIPKPAPLTYFRIVSTTDDKIIKTVKTDITGKIDLRLPPGKYLVSIDKPLEFKGRSYFWKGEVTIGVEQITKIDWSDADATTDTLKPARQISDEAAIYKMRKSGVVTVEGDFGSGSGFIIDPRGLILTNQHVVNGGRWAAVRFDRGIRVPAVVVEEDKAADVAVICVNPDAFKDFTVVPLADPSAGPLAVEGEKVLTVGSPLNQEKVLTIGIVSKVETDYLISDININHGNSGGPLLNMAGEAIGLTTFLDATYNGPGISGIVSIGKALPVIARARDRYASVHLPALDRLPDISTVPIPGEALSAYSVKDAKLYSEGRPKNFETTFVTPFYMAALQAEYEKSLNGDRKRRVEKRDKNGVREDLDKSPSKFWERYALHSADPVVWIVVKPLLKTKASSMWAGVFGAIGGVHVQTTGEFRDDFYDMALYRGDTLVHPVRRFRENVAVLYSDYESKANDNAYGGIYFYDPSVFAPGAKLTLYVRRESNLKRWDIEQISEKEQARMYKMFLPYRTALAQAEGDSSSTEIRGLSATIHTPPAAGSDWTTEDSETATNISQTVTPTAKNR
jgi:hypothetical protein